MISFIIIVLLAGFNVYMVVRHTKLKDVLKAKDEAFDQFETFTFHNAIFVDTEGRYQGTYNSDEITEKWDKYTNLNMAYRRTK